MRLTVIDLLLVTVTITLLIVTLETAAQDTGECIHGDVELRLDNDDDDILNGYVLYCSQGEWRLICTRNGDIASNSAAVLCSQLGFKMKISNRIGYSCSDTQASITLSDYSHVELIQSCNGTENSLQECVGVRRIDLCDCNPSAYSRFGNARVVCDPADCANGDIRLSLVGGSTDREGRVEVCVDGRWGTVQTNQPREIAQRVCIQESLTLYDFSTCLGERYGYRLSKPVYNCSDQRLICSKNLIRNHSMDLGVVCRPSEEIETDCTDGEVRLVGGTTNRTGRVEVCVDGLWRAVCNNSQEGIAGAVCSQQGFAKLGAESESVSVSEESIGVYMCSYDNETNNITCMETCCNSLMSLKVKCLSHEQVTMTTMSTTDTTTEVPSAAHDGTVTVAGVLVAVLVVVGVSLLLLVTCVVVRRRQSLKKSSPDPSTLRNESYSLTQPTEQVYDIISDSETNYSSLGPVRNVLAINNEELDTYDVLNHNQQQANTPQARPASPTSVRDEAGKKRDEASKKRDDFYDAEQHTYAAVNINRKKKRKKNKTGNEEEEVSPPLGDVPMTGEVSREEQEVVYFNLKH